MRRSPHGVWLVTSAAVALVDLITKQVALSLIDGREVPVADAMRLVIMHNEQLGWGISVGPWAPLVSVVSTMLLIVLVAAICRDLADVDARAPVLLGLIVGAALGNGIDAVVAPNGVTDFIAVRAGDLEIVFNLADVAVMSGLAMATGTAWRLAEAAQLQRQGGEPGGDPRPADARLMALGAVMVPVERRRPGSGADWTGPERRRQRS